MHSVSAPDPRRLPKTPAHSSSKIPHPPPSPRHTWNSTRCLLVSILSRESPQKSQPNPTFKPPLGQSTSRPILLALFCPAIPSASLRNGQRSEEHTSELQSLTNLVCRLLLEKKKTAWTRRRCCDTRLSP